MIAAQRSIAISTSHRHQAAAASLSGVSSVPHNSINHKLMDAHRSMHARQTSQPSPAGRTSFSSDPEQPLMMASHPVSRRNHHLPTIALLSDAVAIQAETQRFERFAGRSAMIGVLVAVVAELLTEQTIFRHLSSDTLAGLASLFLGVVSLAAAAAAASKRRTGLELLEAVTTSLTANQRSAASVTGRQVDIAVDNVLNKVFDRSVMSRILAGDDDSNI